jgi:hypothetical protein
MEQQQFDEIVLEEMGRPNWNVIRTFLAQQALIARDSCADAPTWEEVCRRRGYADGLAFVVNMRDNLIAIKEQEDAAV